MISDSLREIMDAVDDLAEATDPLVRNTARSLICMKVARLTGDSLQSAFDALREPPPSTLKVGTGHRKPKPKETLDQVVESVMQKIRIVPVSDEVGGGTVPWGEES